MDVEWAKSRLQNFIYEFGDADRCAQWDSDQVMPLLPTVARILEVIGEPVPSYSAYEWGVFNQFKDAALRGVGILDDWDEIALRLRPDAPNMAADRFHHWVWEAARPSWGSGLFRAAVHHAASAINEQLQKKLMCQALSDNELIQEAFSEKPPASNRARLRVLGELENKTTASRQRGALQLGLACFGLSGILQHMKLSSGMSSMHLNAWLF
jgi:hypothetical protein